VAFTTGLALLVSREGDTLRSATCRTSRDGRRKNGGVALGFDALAEPTSRLSRKKKKGVVSSYLQTRIGFVGITHLATTDLARDTRIWPARAATSAVVVDMAIA